MTRNVLGNIMSLIRWIKTRNVLQNIVMELDNITQVHMMVRQHLKYNGSCCSLTTAYPFHCDDDSDDGNDEGIYV